MTEPSATEFTPTYTWFANQGAYYTKDATQTTSTSVFYEMKTRDSSGNDTTPSWMVGQYGIEFRYENGGTVLYCNTGDNNDIPYTFANGAVSQSVSVGDSVTGKMSDGSTAYTFTVISGMLWTSSGGGTSTEEVGTPSGSLTYRNGTVYYLIDPASPTSSSIHKYGIQEDGVWFGLSADTIPHTQGQYTSGSVSGSLGSVYSLKYTNTDGTSSTIALATITASKGSKVFCNFW